MFEFCLPTGAKAVPSGPDWYHEIKYDGFRLRVERNGDRVRLFTRGGYDWTKRYPWIVEACQLMDAAGIEQRCGRRFAWLFVVSSSLSRSACSVRPYRFQNSGSQIEIFSLPVVEREQQA
jgi:hypothetical protein